MSLGTDVVRLLRDLPQEQLRKGMVGTVIEVFESSRVGYEIEFVDGRGRTTAQVALAGDDLEPARDDADYILSVLNGVRELEQSRGLHRDEIQDEKGHYFQRAAAKLYEHWGAGELPSSTDWAS